MSPRRSRIPGTFGAHERKYGLFLPGRFGFRRDPRTGEYTEHVVAALLVVKPELLRRKEKR